MSRDVKCVPARPASVSDPASSDDTVALLDHEWKPRFG
jgi:hypothetical protein